MNNSTPGQRVKVFTLDSEGLWQEKGSGRISCKYVAALNAQALQVLSDGESDSGKAILQAKIEQDGEVYTRQGATIIVCDYEPDQVALSFEDTAWCESIWSKLCSIQGHVYTPNATAENDNEAGSDGEKLEQIEVADVPNVTTGNLEEIARIFEQVVNVGPVLKSYYAQVVLCQRENEESYLRQLLALFKPLEASGDWRHVHLLFCIIKCIALLNESPIYQALLSDENFDDVVGVLEYDPELPERPLYREYLKTNSKYKEVVAVKDESVMGKAKQNFRIGFMKDVLLPRALDERSLSVLSEMELMNGVEIVQSLHEDEEFIPKLFKLLREKETMARGETVAFLQELCNLAKQLPERPAFYRSLVDNNNNLFSMLEAILLDEKASTSERLHVGEILKLILEHHAELFRSYILESSAHPVAPPTDGSVMLAPATFGVNKDKKTPLMSQLIKCIVFDTDAGMQAQACDVLRTMLDPESMQVSDKETFLSVFYDNYVQWLVYPLNFCSKRRRKKEGLSRAQLVSYRKACETASVAEHHIIELLAMCVQTHGYRIKYFVLRNNILAKVLCLLESKEKHLQLDAVRFVRTCIGLKDDFYNKFIVRDDLFSGVFSLFVRNGNRNNLVNSAIIELLEFIAMENFDKLIKYVVEKYSKVLEHVDYVKTFETLKKKYDEKNKDNDVEKEEAYFESNNDEQQQQQKDKNNSDPPTSEFKPPKRSVQDKDEEEGPLSMNKTRNDNKQEKNKVEKKRKRKAGSNSLQFAGDFLNAKQDNAIEKKQCVEE